MKCKSFREAVKKWTGKQRALAWRHYRQNCCHLNNFSFYFNLLFSVPRRHNNNRFEDDQPVTTTVRLLLSISCPLNRSLLPFFGWCFEKEPESWNPPQLMASSATHKCVRPAASPMWMALRYVRYVKRLLIKERKKEKKIRKIYEI